MRRGKARTSSTGISCGRSTGSASQHGSSSQSAARARGVSSLTAHLTASRLRAAPWAGTTAATAPIPAGCRCPQVRFHSAPRAARLQQIASRTRPPIRHGWGAGLPSYGFSAACPRHSPVAVFATHQRCSCAQISSPSPHTCGTLTRAPLLLFSDPKLPKHRNIYLIM